MKLETINFPILKNGTLRVIYLRPSLVAEEAIAVGVLFQDNNKLHLTNIESSSAYEMLRHLRGNSTADNVTFSLQLLKQQITKSVYIDEFIPQVTNLFLGNTQSYACEDPTSFAKDYLHMASCLLKDRKYEPAKKNITHHDISSILFNKVSQLDVITATRLFEGYNLEVSHGKVIKFPMYGQRIIAAPVSMITKQINSAKIMAEAYCAKLSIARDKLRRKPYLYIMTPSLEKNYNHSLLEDCLGELEYVANANNIYVRIEKNTEELARAVLHDENG